MEQRPLSDRFSRLFFSVVTILQNETAFRIGEQLSLTSSVGITAKPKFSKSNDSLLNEFRNGDHHDDDLLADVFHVPDWVYILMTAFYACIFILGIGGNLLVILVIAKDRRMRTTANFYLISLSVADLMIIAFCLPVAVYELHAEEVWNLGPVLCKLAPLLQYISTNASICTMVAISIERYIAVCRPLKVRTYCTNARAGGLIIMLWFFSFACSSPLLYFTAHEKDWHHKLNKEVYVCFIQNITNEVYFYFHQACFYLLPGLLLSVLYSRIVWTLRQFKSERFGHSPDSRKNAAPGSKAQADTKQLIFMLSAVVLSYFVCLLPYNCITFLSLVSHRTLVDLGPIGYNVFLAVSRIMFFVNSCANPILYNAISGKFRDAFRKFFCPSRFKNRGFDSTRTVSVKSGRGANESNDQLLNRRYRPGAIEHVKFEHASSNRSTSRGAISGTFARRTWSNTYDSGSESVSAIGMTRSDRSDGCISGKHRSLSASRSRSGLGFSRDEKSSIISRRAIEKSQCVVAEL